MYARTVAMHLKPNTMSEFRRRFDSSVLPVLRKQIGFQDAILFSGETGTTDVHAMSLWDTQAHADAYNSHWLSGSAEKSQFSARGNSNGSKFGRAQLYAPTCSCIRKVASARRAAQF